MLYIKDIYISDISDIFFIIIIFHLSICLMMIFLYLKIITNKCIALY